MLTPFELIVPHSMEEAIPQLTELGKKCRIMAGGTDVLVEMHAGHDSPGYVMDIKNIPELKGLEYIKDTGLLIGALTTHAQLEKSDMVKSLYPALFDGVSQVGSVQIRNRATIGGNICTAAPSGDSLGPLLSLDAKLLLQGVNGKREVLFKDFFIGPKKTILQEGELLTHIFVPSPPANSSSAYTKFTRRNAMDLAMLGVSINIACEEYGMTCSQIRIALSTAGPTPMRAIQAEAYLQGRELTEQVLKKAGEMASREAKPRSSLRASEEYRRELLKVLVPRTINNALSRMQKGCGC